MPYSNNAIMTARRRQRAGLPANPSPGFRLGDWEVLRSWSAQPSWRRMVEVRCCRCGFVKTSAWENLKVAVTTCRWRPDQERRHVGRPTAR